MRDPETPDEAYERLRRETRLSEQIHRLEAGLGKLELCVLSTPEVMLLLGQLRELRARRVAMGREPDDELNAPADMCCCNVCLQGAPAKQFRDGCPLHPQAAPGRRDYRLPVSAPQIQAGIAAGTLVCDELCPDCREVQTGGKLCPVCAEGRALWEEGKRSELTGAEFLEEATAALGGGLELRDGMGFCVACGSRDCICDPDE